jgi:hypothetical protein
VCYKEPTNAKKKGTFAVSFTLFWFLVYISIGFMLAFVTPSKVDNKLLEAEIVLQTNVPLTKDMVKRIMFLTRLFYMVLWLPIVVKSFFVVVSRRNKNKKEG